MQKEEQISAADYETGALLGVVELGEPASLRFFLIRARAGSEQFGVGVSSFEDCSFL